jgi:hypothetical protein
MSRIIVVPDFNRRWCGGNLNMRQLLNPIFYDGAWAPKRRPDSTRQRKARQLAKDLRAARRLKAEYVPLVMVDRTIYLDETLRQRSRIIECPKYGTAYRRRVRESCDEVAEGDGLRSYQQAAVNWALKTPRLVDVCGTLMIARAS